MNFERLTDASHPLYEEAMALYSVSFPPHELRRDALQRQVLLDGRYHFDLIMESGEFVGLMLCWEAENFFYVEHFCTVPHRRGQGLGKKALELLGEKGKKLILEIDPPEDAVSIRRRGFYERCGFVENPYLYYHPPYYKEGEPYRLVLMSNPNGMTPEELEVFVDYHRNVAMATSR